MMTDTQDMPEAAYLCDFGNEFDGVATATPKQEYDNQTEYQRKDIADERVRAEQWVSGFLAEMVESALLDYRSAMTSLIAVNLLPDMAGMTRTELNMKMEGIKHKIDLMDQALNRYREHRKGDKSSG
jgi:hypothetical protein